MYKSFSDPSLAGPGKRSGGRVSMSKSPSIFRSLFFLSAALAAVVLCAPQLGLAQTKKPATAPKAKTGKSTVRAVKYDAQRPGTHQRGPVYIIGPGDKLEIVVWREQELTRRGVLVRPDGRISMPLTDDILAAGLTPMQLKYRITKVLSHYIEAPQVYVILDKPVHFSFSVLGNVVRPGTLMMSEPTDVLQALAMVGGFNEWADKDDVMILRGIGPNRKIMPFDYEEVIEGEAPQQNIILKPGDIIIVP